MQPPPPPEPLPPLAPPEPPSPPPAPARRTPGPLVWFSIIGVVVLLAGGLAGFLILRSSVPSSGEELATLLVAPDARNSASVQITVATGPIQVGVAGFTATDGVRWTVARVWTADQARTGVISVTQYATNEQAIAGRAAVQRRFNTVLSVRQPVPGYDNADVVVDRTFGPRSLLRRISGTGVTGPFVVVVDSTGEAPEFIQQLLTQQLDRLA